MLKNKIMKILNESKKVFEKRKKEICAGALGVVLLAGVGVSIGVMSNGVNDSNKTSVVDKVVGKDKADKGEATDEKDELVDNNVVENADGNESVEVTPEENSTDNTTSSNGVGSEDRETSSNSGTSNSESKPSNGSSSNSKPSTGGSSSNSKPSTGSSSNSKPSKPSTGGSSSNSKPSTGGTSKPEAHTHNWVAITQQIHHDEEGHWEECVVTPAWTEEVPIYEQQARDICNTCGADLTGTDISAHVKKHMMAGEDKGGHRTEWVQVQVGTNKIEHPAVTDKKWIVDKAAWTETVTTGHKCNGCGATK